MISLSYSMKWWRRDYIKKKNKRRFIEAGLWDEARIFVADVMLGGGTKAAEIRGGRLVDTEDVGGDRLLRYVRV